ncbi:MAG: hypothetical protein NC427_02360 [Ruminococcus flavefaciens]|nr:hypothetical protein [Ruminococcus flavefaciens]
MQEQDKRAVESMCRCGLDLKSVISVFPKLPGEEIAAIYKSVNGRDMQADGEHGISINCS